MSRGAPIGHFIGRWISSLKYQPQKVIAPGHAKAATTSAICIRQACAVSVERASPLDELRQNPEREGPG
jgi:hypothetical protein